MSRDDFAAGMRAALALAPPVLREVPGRTIAPVYDGHAVAKGAKPTYLASFERIDPERLIDEAWQAHVAGGGS